MEEQRCYCCGREGRFNILLYNTFGRLYLPNQSREEGPPPEIFWFCHPCMRMIEDNFRATVNYLLDNGGPKFRKP